MVNISTAYFNIKSTLNFYHTVFLCFGRPEFDSRQRQEVSACPTASRLALRPTQPPIQWVPGALSAGVKRPDREADQSPFSSAEAW
jgi:hypothetical protein